MKNKILLFPFIALMMSSCSLLDLFKKDNVDGSGKEDHIVNIGEFRNAVNLNYKNFSFSSKQTINGEERDYTSVKALEDGSFYQKCNENDSEYYWKRDTDGSYIHVAKYGNDWIVDQIINKLTFETDYYTDDSELIWTLYDLVDDYTGFAYNENNNFYETSLSLKGVSTKIALKFDDKKLADVNFISDTNVISLHFYDYNATSIDFDSLNIKNNLYISGRTFTFKELRCETPIPNLDEEEFATKNKDATLIFDESSNFNVHFEMDFMPPYAEHDYSGTYSYNKLEQTASLMVPFQGSNVNVKCNLSIDPNNYSSGALLTARLYAPSNGLDAYVDFYIK